MDTPDMKGLLSQPHAFPHQNLLSFCSSCSNKTHSPATDLNTSSREISAGNHCRLPHENSFENPDSSIRVLPNSHQVRVPLHAFSPNASSLSTEDESRDDEYQLSIENEKRLRRIISNRDSARRSRMRKKKQIEELQLQVGQLQTVNDQLSQKLINLLESNHRILQENAQLKDKVSTLHFLLTDLFAPMRNPENTTHHEGHQLRAETTNQSTLH